jgi:glycosyltransferase involved in cell wall biosynthesis
MRVIWISNIIFGHLSELLEINKYPSGTWLDAAYLALEKVPDIELFIITVSNVNEIRSKKVGKHSFYILPGGNPIQYDINSLKNKEIWTKIQNEIKPDLIQLWGTEYGHGYLAIKTMANVPSVVYMQGLMSQIARQFVSNISIKEQIKNITLRDIIKFDWLSQQQRSFYKRAKIESEILNYSGNIIVENNWCESHCKAIAPNSNTFKSKLSIKNEFFLQEWDVNKMIPYSIMCNAGGLPFKGLHILLKALSLVIQSFPDTKLLIPGFSSPFNKTFKENLRINGYNKFIISLIKEYGLINNIQFLGFLNSEEMAEYMSKSNVFVMPSSIENHSSTLIEAMIVGIPCISSYVGGISEFLTHDMNGLIYRFEEHEILANHICKIFEDPTFASKIALNGKNLMRNSRNSNNIKDDFIEIYNTLLN